VATRIAGSIPAELARTLSAGASEIRIAHASGITAVDAKIAPGGEGGEPFAEYAAVYRTARRLFAGRVLYRTRGD
jgi:2-methylaconitate cis-trans-isomerase PrpF